MSEDLKYRHVVRAVSETPWAILESTLRSIREMVALRASGERFSREEIEARIGNGPGRGGLTMAGPVAIVSLYGVIVPRADMFTDISGGTSVQSFAADFQAAVDDPDVKAIVVDTASPGGSTDLITETAAQIRAARGSKPMVGQANVYAASAGYWLIAQLDEVVVPPSGEVGSMGIITMHDDISGAQEQAGVKTKVIHATDAPFKAELSPFEPLSPEAEAHLQESVDEMMGLFVADVAKGRGVSVETVKRDFGQGRMVTARKAVSAGMADRVDTLENTIARLANANGRARVGSVRTGKTWIPGFANESEEKAPEVAESGLSFADAADEALRALNAVVTGSEALRALTGVKRDQLTALIERGQQVLAQTEPAKPLENALGHELDFAWQQIADRI